MSDVHIMADVGNISPWTTEPPRNNVTDMTNEDSVQKIVNVHRTLNIILLLICLVGLVGNGLVLWCVFRIQKNPCIVYIINLAIADTVFLVGCFIIVVLFICVQSGLQGSETDQSITLIVGGIMYNIGFNTSSFLLAAISMERCLSVCSTMWYNRRQLKKQYIIVCVVLWVLGCLVMGLEDFVCYANVEYPLPGSERCTAVYLFTSCLYLVVVMLMIVSSVALLIDIQKTSKQCHPLRLYIIILLTVIVFHLSVVPARVLGLLLYFKVLSSDDFMIDFMYVTFICTSIYCSANPYVYIFVGIWRRQCFQCSVQQGLKNVFKEETESSNKRQELNNLRKEVDVLQNDVKI